MRTLWIPVAGTVAALVAILLAHGERGPSEPPPPSFPDSGDFDLPPDTPPLPPTPKAPEAREWQLILQPDGSFLTAAGDESFANAEEILKRLAPTESYRPKILLTNASGEVAAEALDAAAAALAARCDLTKRYYRAPDEEKGG